jgi:hypothetical protein
MTDLNELWSDILELLFPRKLGAVYRRINWRTLRNIFAPPTVPVTPMCLIIGIYDILKGDLGEKRWGGVTQEWFKNSKHSLTPDGVVGFRGGLNIEPASM